MNVASIMALLLAGASGGLAVAPRSSALLAAQRYLCRSAETGAVRGVLQHQDGRFIWSAGDGWPQESGEALAARMVGDRVFLTGAGEFRRFGTVWLELPAGAAVPLSHFAIYHATGAVLACSVR